MKTNSAGKAWKALIAIIIAMVCVGCKSVEYVEVGFDSVKDLQFADSQMVIDVTYYALVYPKTIRVVSKYKPNKAEVV